MNAPILRLVVFALAIWSSNSYSQVEIPSPKEIQRNLKKAREEARTRQEQEKTPIPTRATERNVRKKVVFEKNQGQVDSQAQFLVRGPDRHVFLTSQEVVTVSAAGEILRMSFVGGNPQGRLIGLEPTGTKTHYYKGRDPRRWILNVPNFGRVLAKDVFPGIDVSYYNSGGRIEFDFIVQAGVSPDVIKLSFHGHSRLSVDAKGQLALKMEREVVRLSKPVAFQHADDGHETPIEAGYLPRGGVETGIQLAEYNQSKTLIVDPQIIFSTYLGGPGYSKLSDIVTDGAGNSVAAGEVLPVGFPITGAPLPNGQGTSNNDVSLTKYNNAGEVLFSVILGGSHHDRVTGIDLDDEGGIYIAGHTLSTDLPITSQALQSTHAHQGFPFSTSHSDGFVARLTPQGDSLVYMTYLGGSAMDQIFDIQVDGYKRAVVGGDTLSSDFPTAPSGPPFTAGTANQQAFVAILNPGGTALVAASDFGGSAMDSLKALALDETGQIYGTGQTASNDFPVVSPGGTNPVQATHAGGFDAFFIHMNPSGGPLVHSTYLGGGTSDFGSDLAVTDGGEMIVVSGQTRSPDFLSNSSPLVPPLQPGHGGGADGFFVALTSYGETLFNWSYFGGSNEENGEVSIDVDPQGNLYLGLVTRGSFLGSPPPLVNSLPNMPTNAPTNRASTVIARVDLEVGYQLVSFSSFLSGTDVAEDTVAGVAVDGLRRLYIAGSTAKTDYPLVNAAQNGNANANGGWNGFIAQVETGDTLIQRLGTSAPGCNGPISIYVNQPAVSSSQSDFAVLASNAPPGAFGQLIVASDGPPTPAGVVWSNLVTLFLNPFSATFTVPGTADSNGNMQISFPYIPPGISGLDIFHLQFVFIPPPNCLGPVQYPTSDAIQITVQ